MTIDEAIEILSSYLHGDLPDKEEDEPAAIRLGIEALKFLKKERLRHPAYYPHDLPGETTEE